MPIGQMRAEKGRHDVAPATAHKVFGMRKRIRELLDDLIDAHVWLSQPTKCERLRRQPRPIRIVRPATSPKTNSSDTLPPQRSPELCSPVALT